jgi:hypothetical protein
LILKLKAAKIHADFFAKLPIDVLRGLSLMITERAWINPEKLRTKSMAAYLMFRDHATFTLETLLEMSKSPELVEMTFIDALDNANRRLAQDLMAAKAKSS